ncbi:MAG TPA: MaoC family dehydratase [Acidimicrobiia bacterium]|nr:MaoC family dehydratase [Acidimicrobiia bacterium]
MSDGNNATVLQLSDLSSSVGKHLGYSDWITVDQAQINTFADATGDHQWIHVDEERAKSGPFGTTIAHGYLTLSLTPRFIFQVLRVEGVSLVVNYGLNKVRFPAPVPSGSRVRFGAELAAADPVSGGVQVTLNGTYEIEGQPKPACVAEIVFRYYS